MASASVMESSKSVMYEENTKVAFPLLLEDGQDLCAVGVRKKLIVGVVPVKIYAFGIYADCKKLKELLKPKFGSGTDGPNREMYDAAINGDLIMAARLEIVFGGLNMRMVRKIFNDNLGASIRKLAGGDHGDILDRVLGEARDDIKLPAGSVICMTKLPVKGEIVSEVESEILCKAFFNTYTWEMNHLMHVPRAILEISSSPISSKTS